jgi:predicted nucleic acid-binding protein
MAAGKKNTILLPTVAISELLVPVSKSQMGALVAVLQKKFVCPPFDLQAACIAADLYSQHKKLPQDQQYDERHILRADAMIVASVLAAGATVFYSHDSRCRTLAGLVMTARDLPTDDPNDMFLKGDIAKGEV